MSSDHVEDTARHNHAEEQVQAFLDCVAYLLAKRWLRESCKGERTNPPAKQPSARQLEIVQ